VEAPAIIILMTVVLVGLSAAIVRVLGVDLGNKVLMVAYALLIVLMTIRGT
jgi:hypothetical protein